MTPFDVVVEVPLPRKALPVPVTALLRAAVAVLEKSTFRVHLARVPVEVCFAPKVTMAVFTWIRLGVFLDMPPSPVISMLEQLSHKIAICQAQHWCK